MNPYQIVTESIIKQLENGVVPWRKPWRTELPVNLISQKHYRGLNIFLLGSQGYGSRYWLTFNQAKKLGGHIRKGEHRLRGDCKLLVSAASAAQKACDYIRNANPNSESEGN